MSSENPAFPNQTEIILVSPDPLMSKSTQKHHMTPRMS